MSDWASAAEMHRKIYGSPVDQDKIPAAPTRRQMLMADRFYHDAHSETQVVERKTLDRVRQLVRAAHKFVLDDAAVEEYARVVREVPDLIAEQQDFARAPYETTWIEFDFYRFYDLTSRRGADRLSDRRCGFLIHQGRAHVITGGSDEYKAPILCPIVYDLHTPPPDSIMTMLDMGRYTPEQFFWGECWYRLTDEQRRSVTKRHTITPLPVITRTEEHARLIFETILPECVADLGRIIAILLLLNRPSLAVYKDSVAASRGFSRGKLRQYMAHTVVTIPLSPVPQLRLLGRPGAERGAVRRHEVRGAWCHNRDAREFAAVAGCEHEWRADPVYRAVDDPDQPDHYVCDACGGKRWWRDAHHRGSAERGFVVKDYSVQGP